MYIVARVLSCGTIGAAYHSTSYSDAEDTLVHLASKEKDFTESDKITARMDGFYECRDGGSLQIIMSCKFDNL